METNLSDDSYGKNKQALHAYRKKESEAVGQAEACGCCGGHYLGGLPRVVIYIYCYNLLQLMNTAL